MNTVIGLACAMGVDMGFNSHPHEEEEVIETTTHHHADGKIHQHHDEAAKQNHHDSKEDSEKEGCCNDDVMKFQSLDKSLTQNANAFINVPVFVAMLSRFFGIDIVSQPKVSDPKPVNQFFHPPPPDIRILIQSFQI